MAKKDRKLIQELLSKALEPPRKPMPRQKLDNLLEDYDDGTPLAKLITPDQKADLKNDQVDLKSDQTSQKTDLDQKDQPEIKPITVVQRPIDASVQLTPASETPASIGHQRPIDASVYEALPLEELDSIGYTKLANSILDTLPQILDPYEMLIYLRLYRLSYGFHSNTCLVGRAALSKATRVSDRQTDRAIAKLLSIGLIKLIEVINTKEVRGSKYEVRVPRLTPNRHQRLIDASVSQTPIKDDHDDLLKKDHHQSEMMMIYQTLTGNSSWTKSDQAAYKKIKHLPLEEISQLIKSTLEKAHQKPNSLAYFVKVYQTPTKANSAQKNAVKSKIEAIVERKREAHVGAKYTIADLSFDVKAECLKEGIIFDNDLFNEILEKK